MEKVTTWFLEMTDFSKFKPAPNFRESITLIPFRSGYVSYMMFLGVGTPWRWYSRLDWSPADWEKYVENSNVYSFLCKNREKIVGYFELFIENHQAEISFLGLLPGLTGKGLGSAMLSHALVESMKPGIKRIWLHTCNNDHPHALGLYQKQGLTLYNSIEQLEDVPNQDKIRNHIATFFSKWIEI